MSTYIVLGAGTFAADLTDMLLECGHSVAGYVVNLGVWSPGMRYLERPVYDARVFPTNWPNEGWPNFSFLPAIISPQRAILEGQMLERNFLCREAFVHKDASVSPSAKILFGAVISRGVDIACGTLIKQFVIVNRSVSIGHHNQILQNVTIGPGAILCGRVTVSVGAVVGAGAVVLEDRHIGPNARVGAGAVVTRDVRAGETVIGVPARFHSSDVEMPATDW